VKAACREFIVSAGCSAILTNRQSKSTGREDPFVQRNAADAKWIREVLVGASTVAIEGDGKAVDAKPGHK
jgi:hypothetical protein